jgi:pyruvate-formate lyase
LTDSASQSLNHGIAYYGTPQAKYVVRDLAFSGARYQFTNADLDVIDYKNKGGLKQDDLRRRREEQQVEIRRQKREENISKRRNLVPSSGIDSDDEAGGSGGLDAPVRVVIVISISF